MDVEGEEKDRGKKRVRTKGLQKKLLEQIEFYFGDANLQRDRFLGEKIKEHPDGYVPVETIASFNRMKSLTTDISIVVQVMKTSTLLEVTEDEKWVRRSKPLPTATDTDERTIYVENLPPNSDQDSIRKLLKVFGNITYVSLPRHKISRKIKGFCFIEFAAVEAANAAVEYFKSGTKPPTLSASHKAQSKKPSGNGGDKGKEGLVEGEMEGEEGARKEGVEGKGERGGEEGGVGGVEGKVEKEGEKGREGGEGGKVEEERETEGEVVESRVEQSEGASEHKETDKEEDDVVSRKRKRGMDVAESCGIEQESAPHTKKSKSDQSTEGLTEEREEQTGKEKEDKKKETCQKGNIEEGTVTTDQSTAPFTRKEEGEGSEVPAQSRKRKRRDEDREEEGVQEGEGGPGGTKSTRTDSLTSSNTANPSNDNDGGEMRLERLDSQTTTDTGGEEEEGLRAEAKKAKKKNRQHKKRDWEAALKALKLRVMSKKEWLEMRKIFRDLQKEKIREMKEQLKQGVEEEEEEEKKRGKYVGKCLVKVEGVGVGEGNDLVTIQKVEEICSKYGAVAYIDIKDGESEGFIRFAKSGCVENLVNAESLVNVKFSAVSDEDERAYYLKTVAARKQNHKYKKKRNIRGQDKIISRALQKQSHIKTDSNKSSSSLSSAPTHIRFSDSEPES